MKNPANRIGLYSSLGILGVMLYKALLFFMAEPVFLLIDDDFLKVYFVRI